MTVDGVTLVLGTVGVTFGCFLLSSDESESDDESFFLLFDAATGVDAAGFLVIGVTATIDITYKLSFIYKTPSPFDATGFLAAVSSSESLLLLDDGAGLFTAFGTGVDVNNGLTGATIGFLFLSSSLDESESDELSFFLAADTAATGVLATDVTGATKKI